MERRQTIQGQGGLTNRLENLHSEIDSSRNSEQHMKRNRRRYGHRRGGHKGKKGVTSNPPAVEESSSIVDHSVCCALTKAVASLSVENVTNVLSQGHFNVNVADHEGWTPLTALCGLREVVDMSAQRQIAEILFMHGANLAMSDIHGNIPIFLASDSFNTELLAGLVAEAHRQECPVPYGPMLIQILTTLEKRHAAAMYMSPIDLARDDASVQMLQKQATEVAMIESLGKTCITLLLHHARTDNVVLECLESRNDKGQTVLHLAAGLFYATIVEALLACVKDASHHTIRDQSNLTPIQYMERMFIAMEKNVDLMNRGTSSSSSSRRNNSRGSRSYHRLSFSMVTGTVRKARCKIGFRDFVLS
jgi:ankyrin repeat protein